jgi:hypothetical protein
MIITIFVLTVATLSTAALIVNAGNIASAQGLRNMTGNTTIGNITQGNMTTEGNLTIVIDVDTLSKNIKARHPLLAQLLEDKDKDLVVKIKDMDTKEALKTEIALNMLRLLQQYKQLDEAQ